MKGKYLKWTVVIVLGVAGVVAVGLAQTQQHSGRGPGMHRRFGFIAKQLQLTDAQQAQIKSLWQAEKPTLTPLLQQLATYRKQMLTATASGKFDSNQVSGIANQEAQVMAKLMVERQKLIAQAYNQVLTPDQRSKADQLRGRHEQHIDNWMQRMSNNGAAAGNSPTQD
jgi:Spy/CpxP family protein refolding chaperone